MVPLYMAFLVGGLLCVIGQIIMDATKPNITPGHILVGYITGGAILSGLGLYQPKGKSEHLKIYSVNYPYTRRTIDLVELKRRIVALKLERAVA